MASRLRVELDAVGDGVALVLDEDGGQRGEVVAKMNEAGSAFRS
jgi:hypothetical protein